MHVYILHCCLSILCWHLSLLCIGCLKIRPTLLSLPTVATQHCCGSLWLASLLYNSLILFGIALRVSSVVAIEFPTTLIWPSPPLTSHQFSGSHYTLLSLLVVNLLIEFLWWVSCSLSLFGVPWAFPLALCPAHTRLPVRNGTNSNFLGLVPKSSKDQRDCIVLALQQ